MYDVVGFEDQLAVPAAWRVRIMRNERAAITRGLGLHHPVRHVPKFDRLAGAVSHFDPIGVPVDREAQYRRCPKCDVPIMVIRTLDQRQHSVIGHLDDLVISFLLPDRQRRLWQCALDPLHRRGDNRCVQAIANLLAVIKARAP